MSIYQSSELYGKSINPKDSQLAPVIKSYSSLQITMLRINHNIEEYYLLVYNAIQPARTSPSIWTVTCLAFSSTVKSEAPCYSETSCTSTALHGVTSKTTALFKVIAVRKSNPTTITLLTNISIGSYLIAQRAYTVLTFCYCHLTN